MKSMMRAIPLLATAAGLVLLPGDGARAQAPAPQPPQAAQNPLNSQLSALKDLIRTAPNELTWGDGPPALPKGAKSAALEGDPGVAGKLYTIRLKFPAGYKVMPHTHPTDEHVTVLSGSLAMGHGDKFDEKELKTLPAGGFVGIPAGHRHFAQAKQETVIQLHGLGPFAITYVNPADDPRNQPAKPSGK